MEDTKREWSLAAYQSEMNEALTRAVVLGLRAGYNSYYNLQFKGEEQLYPLAGKGFVLLPNHQSNQDITLEGCLLQSVLGVHAHYLMKSSFPKPLLYLFRKLGGIELSRGKDIRKLKEEAREHAVKEIRRQEKEAGPYAEEDRKRKLRELVQKEVDPALHLAATREDDVYRRIVSSLLSQNQIIVSHPEGERQKNWTAPNLFSAKKNMRNFLDTQDAIGKPITFVPLGVHYQRMYVPRSRVTLHVGVPIEVPNSEAGLETLMQHWGREVAR